MVSAGEAGHLVAVLCVEKSPRRCRPTIRDEFADAGAVGFHLGTTAAVAAVESDEAGPDAIRATFAGFASAAEDWAQGRGCLLCNTAVERAVLDPASGDHVDAYFDRLTIAFRNALHNGQRAGEIRMSADVDELAAFFTMALIGIATLAKGRAQPNQIRAACRVVADSLKAHAADGKLTEHWDSATKT